METLDQIKASIAASIAANEHADEKTASAALLSLTDFQDALDLALVRNEVDDTLAYPEYAAYVKDLLELSSATFSEMTEAVQRVLRAAWCVLRTSTKEPELCAALRLLILLEQGKFEYKTLPTFAEILAAGSSWLSTSTSASKTLLRLAVLALPTQRNAIHALRVCGENPEVATACCRTLDDCFRTITTGTPVEKIGSTGVVTVLAATLGRHAGVADVVRHACSALLALATYDVALAAAMDRVNCVAILGNVLTRHIDDAALVSLAVRLNKKVTDSWSVGNARAFCVTEVGERVFLKHALTDDAVAKICAEMLLQHAQQTNAVAKTAFFERGGVALAAKLMAKYSGTDRAISISMPAAKAVMYGAMISHDNSAWKVEDYAVVKTLVSVVQTAGTQSAMCPIAHYCCFTLAKLTPSAELKTKMLTLEIVEAVSAFLMRHAAGCHEVATQGCFLLSALCDSQDGRRAARALGGIAAMEHVLKVRGGMTTGAKHLQFIGEMMKSLAGDTP
jgi:hypothetical protein